MQITRLEIENFRGIRNAVIDFMQHSVLIGDNNVGKTTILEAIDLLLGPDRLRRLPPINEYDFYKSNYYTAVNLDEEQSNNPRINLKLTLINLNDDQKARFFDYLEFYDTSTGKLYDSDFPEGIDEENITESMCITFIGFYDPEEDDFLGKTYYSRSLQDDDNPKEFSKKDKLLCGFLYLRNVRTGSRALSLEHGSLLDIILRLKELRPQLWEDTISKISEYTVASDPKHGVSGVLSSINDALKKYVPKEWGSEPQLKVSNLTREHLRKNITAFISTGSSDHIAPFFMQGTGTKNMLVLAMLSIIAEQKQNVIFAMEEPETAVPPYAQKRIVHEIKGLSAQTIFTSHSPYVIEEFDLEEVVLLNKDEDDKVVCHKISLPKGIKPKRYRQQFRTRFCEGLLSPRILIAEGSTETQSFPAACRRLYELDSNKYAPLEQLGISTIDADGETNIPSFVKLYNQMGKKTFVICDNQNEEHKKKIVDEVDQLFMHPEKGFENLVLKNTTEDALKRYLSQIELPEKYEKAYPEPDKDVIKLFAEYFKDNKADGAMADFLSQCTEDEIPSWIRKSAIELKELLNPLRAKDYEESGIEKHGTD